jgi:hypothetical protein
MFAASVATARESIPRFRASPRRTAGEIDIGASAGVFGGVVENQRDRATDKPEEKPPSGVFAGFYFKAVFSNRANLSPA